MVIGTKIFVVVLSLTKKMKAHVASVSPCNMEMKFGVSCSCSHGQREFRVRPSALVAQSLQSSHFSQAH